MENWNLIVIEYYHELGRFVAPGIHEDLQAPYDVLPRAAMQSLYWAIMEEMRRITDAAGGWEWSLGEGLEYCQI